MVGSLYIPQYGFVPLLQHPVLNPWSTGNRCTSVACLMEVALHRFVNKIYDEFEVSCELRDTSGDLVSRVWANWKIELTG